MPLQKKKPVAMVRETGFKLPCQLEIKDNKILAESAMKFKFVVAQKALVSWSLGGVK